ncbi:MAG TPA: hypothetical protein VLY63_17365 [Anaerolineae bacterium]|nr:hypothetical protein [Anaerolineae bacterium]
MIRRLVNLAFAVLLAPLFLAFSYEGALFLVSVFTLDSTMWFLLGAALALPLSLLGLSKNIMFIEHLLHELEHAVVAFFFTFQLPRRLEVDPEQGSKVYVPTRGGCLVTLAPYYFPMLTVPFLILKALAALLFSLLKVPFPALLVAVLDLLVGAALMFHYITTLKEFRFSQPDIKKTGLIASIVGVLFLNFMFLVLSIAVVTGSYPEFLDFLKSAVPGTVDAYKAALEFLKARLLPALDDLQETLVGQL